MRRCRITLIVCTLATFAPAAIIHARSQGPAELLYAPDRFLQTPSLHPGFRFGSSDQGTPSRQANDLGGAQRAVTLRAGVVEEIIDEPGKIKTGEITWALERSVTDEPFARGVMLIGAKEALEVVIVRRHPTHGPITMTITTGAALGFEPEGLAMPRLRRTSAAEGEPLFGRVQRKGEAQFVIELSQQPIDEENNLDRLLTRPWLDLIFRQEDGVERVVTLEIGRVGAAIMRAAMR